LTCCSVYSFWNPPPAIFDPTGKDSEDIMNLNKKIFLKETYINNNNINKLNWSENVAETANKILRKLFKNKLDKATN
jgi:hypothetical protein